MRVAGGVLLGYEGLWLITGGDLGLPGFASFCGVGVI